MLKQCERRVMFALGVNTCLCDADADLFPPKHVLNNVWQPPNIALEIFQTCPNKSPKHPRHVPQTYPEPATCPSLFQVVDPSGRNIAFLIISSLRQKRV